MAEKKQHTIVSASESKPVTHQVKPAAPVGNAAGLRVGAVILWVCALAFEVLALLVVLGKLALSFLPTLWQLIGFLALDLICVSIGSLLWKKANRIKPASKSDKFRFWLWNNMGLIVCVVAFVPFVILLLSNKNLDKKTKTIATVVALIALLIGGAVSYDYNPVSLEEQQAAIENVTTDVYWAPFGKVYHTHEDCQALSRTDELTCGTVEEAIAANRTRLCAFCAREDGITGVTTDEAE